MKESFGLSIKCCVLQTRRGRGPYDTRPLFNKITRALDGLLQSKRGNVKRWGEIRLIREEDKEEWDQVSAFYHWIDQQPAIKYMYFYVEYEFSETPIDVPIEKIAATIERVAPGVLEEIRDFTSFIVEDDNA